MKNRTQAVILAVLMTLLVAAGLFAMPVESYADVSTSRFSLTGETYPVSLSQGSSFTLKGTLTGKNNITRVEVAVVDQSTGKYVSGFYFNKTGLNTKSYSIANADSSLKFGQLPAGSYYYRIWAHDSTGWELVLDKAFTVKGAAASGWKKENGEWYYYKNGAKVTNGWAKDSKGWCWLGSDGRIVKSRWIQSGGQWYYLKANGYMAANEWAKDSKGWCWMDANGRITKDQWIETGGQKYYLNASGYWDPDATPGDSTTPASTSQDRFKVESAVYPGTLIEGRSFSISGTLSGTNPITRVIVGIADRSTDKMLDGFSYDESGINAVTFDISRADSSIRFGQLPAGNYYYRIIAYDSAGSLRVVNRAFSVISVPGWVKEDGVWYYYQENGEKLTNGWAQDTVGWCWLDASGRIVKDRWIKDGGEWYYLKPNGYMAAGEWAKDSAGWCWMNAAGRITKDKWIKYKGDWYYLKANGYMAAGEWAKDSAGWCWLGANGKMVKNAWIEYNGYQYFLDSGGHWVTGGTVLGYNTSLISAIGKQPYSGPCGIYAMAYCRVVIDGVFPLDGYATYQDKIIKQYGLGSSYAYWGRGGGSMVTYSTDTSMYRAAYDQIAAGKPCIINCYNPHTGNNHFVAAIGYITGTTRSNVTLNSFIVLDPATGTQRKMSETGYQSPSKSPYGPEMVRF